jgi:hypothetical protein
MPSAHLIGMDVARHRTRRGGSCDGDVMLELGQRVRAILVDGNARDRRLTSMEDGVNCGGHTGMEVRSDAEWERMMVQ